MKRGLFYLLTLLFLLLIILGIGEAFLRYQGWFYTYIEKRSGFFVEPYEVQEDNWLFVNTPNTEWDDESPDFSYLVNINSEGLRDKEHPIEKDSNEVRIICLGDSYTQGIGAPADSMWVQTLEDQINAISDTFNYTVMKGGVSGSDPFYEAMLFKLNYLKYQPDMVFLAVNESDIDDVLVRGGNERFLPDSTIKYNPKPAINPLFKYSHLVRFYYIGLMGYSWFYLSPEQHKAKREEAAKLIADGLMNLSAFCKARDIQFTVITHPTFGEALNGQYDPEIQLVIKELKRSGVSVCNVLSHFLQRANIRQDNAHQFYWPVDGHNNPKGYTHFANGVLNCFKNEMVQ